MQIYRQLFPATGKPPRRVHVCSGLGRPNSLSPVRFNAKVRVPQSNDLATAMTDGTAQIDS